LLIKFNSTVTVELKNEVTFVVFIHQNMNYIMVEVFTNKIATDFILIPLIASNIYILLKMLVVILHYEINSKNTRVDLRTCLLKLSRS